jgi:hypothetical protein
MQIGEHIARQRRDGKRFGRFVSIVGTIGFVPVAIMASQLPKGAVLLILLAVILPTMVVAVVHAWRIRCPRCQAILPSRVPRTPELRCPHCGADFSQPMPRSQ